MVGTRTRPGRGKGEGGEDQKDKGGRKGGGESEEGNRRMTRCKIFCYSQIRRRSTAKSKYCCAGCSAWKVVAKGGCHQHKRMVNNDKMQIWP